MGSWAPADQLDLDVVVALQDGHQPAAAKAGVLQIDLIKQTFDEPVLRILGDLPPSDAVRDRVVALGGKVEPVAKRWSITIPSGE